MAPGPAPGAGAGGAGVGGASAGVGTVGGGEAAGMEISAPFPSSFQPRTSGMGGSSNSGHGVMRGGSSGPGGIGGFGGASSGQVVGGVGGNAAGGGAGVGGASSAGGVVVSSGGDLDSVRAREGSKAKKGGFKDWKRRYVLGWVGLGWVEFFAELFESSPIRGLNAPLSRVGDICFVSSSVFCLRVTSSLRRSCPVICFLLYRP